MIWNLAMAMIAILDALLPCVQVGPGGVFIPVSQGG